MEKGPKTLDELLQVVPGLSRLRSLNASMLRVLLDRKKKQCTWCGSEVKKPRLNWCGDKCLEEFNMRCSPQSQAREVIERDKGICSICNRDINQQMELFKSAWEEELKKFPSLHSSDRWKAHDSMERKFGGIRGVWMEVDHILPVIEGGGLCGLDNLRLLCAVCHKGETRKLAKRRREAA